VLSLLGIEPGPGLDGVDLQSERRDAAYAETWTHETEPKLVQAALRTATEKFVVRNYKGNIDEFDDAAVFSLDNVTFVKKAYLAILGREAEPAGLDYHVGVLENKTMSKEGLLQHFLNVEEYLMAPRHAYYNLVSDPLENAPIDPAGHPDWPQRLELIESISSATNKAEDVFVK
jgi:hypothetical protein